MVISSLLLGAALLGADAPDVKITKVSMFKNGYAVVVREIPVRAVGETFLKELPQARLGTLWFSASSGLKVDGITLTDVPATNRIAAASFEDMLSLNIGKEITVDLINLPQVTGKLLRADGTVLLIQDSRGVQAVAKSELRRISIGGSAVTERENEYSIRALRFNTSGTPGTITMMSLEQGLTWVPAYAIDISDKKKLSIVAKATILNDIGSLDGIEARLVTGFPNIKYQGVLEPIIQAFVGRGFVPEGITSFSYDPTDNSLITQNAPAPGRGGAAAGRQENFSAGAGFVPDGVGGIQSEDLFFYRQPEVVLKKGERGNFVLFRSESEYKHIYTWDILDSIADDTNYRGIPEAAGDVWHSLRFKNTSGQPFTTATALTMQDGEILGQDRLDYTSPGAEATVKITKALDIRAEGSEEEVSRERSKISVGAVSYDLVELTGTLEITSRKSEPIKLEITKDLTGDEVTADHGGKVVKTARGLRSVNPRARINWDQTIEPGKTVRLMYRYKVYVRR